MFVLTLESYNCLEELQTQRLFDSLVFYKFVYHNQSELKRKHHTCVMLPVVTYL